MILLTGQIAAGKSTLARKLSAIIPAQHFSVDDSALCSFRGEELGKHLARNALHSSVIFESTGTASDFEDMVALLEKEVPRVFVLKLLCSPTTSLERIRLRGWRPPRWGDNWEAELQWTSRRLRSLPADLTIDSDTNTEDEIVARVVRFLEEHSHDENWPGLEPVSGTFSYSRLATFERCPLAFRYRFLDGQLQSFLAEETLFGESIHKAISWLYRPLSPSSSVTLGELLKRYAAIVRDLPNTCAPALIQALLKKGEQMLSNHFANMYLFDSLETIATEERVSLNLAPGIVFVGNVDRLARTRAGTMVVVDYKTGSPRESYVSSAPDLLQIESYALAIMHGHGISYCEARRHDFRTGREQRLVISGDDSARIRLALKRWIRRAETSPRYDATPGKYCRWCSHYYECPSRIGEPSLGCRIT